MSTHFLNLNDLSSEQLLALLDRAIELKTHLSKGATYTPLKHKTLVMIFNKASTRTRVSFEIGMRQLGGSCINLTPMESQLGRGESIEDTARVLSSMADAILIRTADHDELENMAQNSAKPIINGLSDLHHPCQLLADLMTWTELRGPLNGIKVAWIGDGNNVCHSWMQAARLCDFELRIATPKDYQPEPTLVEENKSRVRMFDQALEAAKDADIVVTDTWASMGQEEEKAERKKAFAGYCVDLDLMQVAAKDALFMHCLPAYRGQEVSAEVIDGNQSVVFTEAENRLHAQKALLEMLIV